MEVLDFTNMPVNVVGDSNQQIVAVIVSIAIIAALSFVKVSKA
jgi:hypothetical protein